MPETKTKQDGDKVRIVKRVIDVVLAAALVVTVIIIVSSIKQDAKELSKPKTSESGSELSSNETVKKDGLIYTSQLMENSLVYDGPLVVVNNDTEFKGTADGLVSMYDVLNDDGTSAYTVMNADVKLHEEAASALNEMVKAFAKETGHEDIVIDGGYRSVEYQQELYDAAEDKSAAAKPGFSDYHTGYSIDLGISSDDGTVGDFDGKDDYSWFEKNCSKYGYVVRYPDGKKDKTGYDYRPWHFRYVGKAAAAYISMNKLCLEEYVKELRGYLYEGAHLMFKGENDESFEVYSFPADKSSDLDSTMVAVPSDKEYTVSGNNSDGFIVSFDKNSTAKPEDKKDSSESSEGSGETTEAETTAAEEASEKTE